MSLRPLIKKQKLRIDDHKWGTGEIKDWNNPTTDIHLDKETYYKIGGKTQYVRIKIPLNSNLDISVMNRKNGEIPQQLKREIRDALNDKKIRQNFINDLIDILKDYQSALSNIDSVRKSIAKIARHFDLEWSDMEISTITNGALESLTKYYPDKQHDRYFIKFDKTSITIGDKNTNPNEDLNTNNNS